MVSTARKSHASNPAACWRRNALHARPRLGAGPNPERRSTVAIVVAETLMPSVSSDLIAKGAPLAIGPCQPVRENGSTGFLWPPFLGRTAEKAVLGRQSHKRRFTGSAPSRGWGSKEVIIDPGRYEARGW
jgi:hypothetical protein